ncbi:hypothetical protein WEI85_41865 [Actinomycetes bacterium KLBMP 9797]
MIVVPVVGALVATAPLAAAEPVEDRSQPGGPAASTSAAFRGPRWEQPETVPSVDAPRASTEEFATVEVRAADRAGNPVEGASYSIYDLDTAAQVGFGRTGPDTTVRLPVGRYSATAMVTTSDTRTMVVLPEVSVTADTTVVFDARDGRQVSVALDEPRAQQVSAAVLVYQRAGNGRTIKYGLGAENFAGGVYVTPTPTRADLTTYVYTFWTRPDLPDVYNLINRSAGRVPARPSYQVRTADLAAVRVRYAAQAVDSCGGTYIGPHLAGTRAPLAYGTTFRLPTQRTEFYTAERAGDVAWYTEFGQTTADCSFDAYDTLTNTPTRYPRRGSYTASWNTAPLAPRTATDADGRPTAVRHGDTMAIGVPMYVDSQPGHADLGDLPAGATGTVKLFHGERLVAESPSPRPLTGQVPPDVGDYRLTASAERNVGWSTLATRTETTWTFRSRTTPEALALPLINARYRLALDDHNRAPADVPVRLSVHFEHPLSIVHTRLSISHDEGGTWRPVTLTGSGDQRHALLRHPAGGSVSLRLEAHDREGNGITQTLIRAYVTR